MNARSPKTLSLLLATLSLGWAGGTLAATTNSWHLEAGPLTLQNPSVQDGSPVPRRGSDFPVERVLPSPIRSLFEALDGGLNAADRERLAQHATLRKAHGWGGGLEQTLYTAVDLETALAQGVQAGWLTESEAQTERGVLKHFSRASSVCCRRRELRSMLSENSCQGSGPT